jgi:hypothetical protein
MGARGGGAGIDFAIGDPAWIGRGVGIELIAVLEAEVRRQHPGAAIAAGPDAGNAASLPHSTNTGHSNLRATNRWRGC